MSRIVTVVKLTIKVNEMKKIITCLWCMLFASCFSTVAWSATGGNASSSGSTDVTEVVRINGVGAISVPNFEPDAGVAAITDDFCLYSNDNSNNYPTAPIIASDSTHAGVGVIDTATANVADLKFDLRIDAPKLTLTGENGAQDKHVLDYIAKVTHKGGTEETDTGCDTDNYTLSLDIDDTDAKEAMAGPYTASVTITVAVRE